MADLQRETVVAENNIHIVCFGGRASFQLTPLNPLVFGLV